LFDDVVKYEEDPSGTSKSIASIKTKFPEEWKAFEEARLQIDGAIAGPLKVYRSRCEKIVKTLFLYHVAYVNDPGMTFEDLMNSVMEWKDHAGGQTTDLQDNRDHYEMLAEKLDVELIQVEKAGNRYRFKMKGRGIDPQALFQKARAEVEQNEVLRRDAWQYLLKLDGWPVQTGLMTLDLSAGLQSVFRSIAPESQQDITIKWHNREISGRVYMRNLLDTARRGALLPSINSAETGLDFAVFISNVAAESELNKLVKDKADARVLFWSPDALSPAEESLLIDFGAYREMVKEAQGKETEKAKLILDWVQGRLGSQMGSIYRIVPDSYGRGRITAADHSALSFLCQGELSSILTPLVGQVLDSTYTCKDMIFDAPAAFNDTNAINVINGIVKAGEFPRNMKPSKEVSASQNYGFSLGIMCRPNDHKLELRDCRYTREMMEWIEEKLGGGASSTGGSSIAASSTASSVSMAAATVHKNFMGIGGPNHINYGLSKRMVQLYLLCLVRDGRIRITLSGKNMPVEAVDYTNVAGIDFKVAYLDAFDQIQRLKPPEGWGVLAPFAAVLLKDETVKTVREDAEIKATVVRLLNWMGAAKEPFGKLQRGLADLFVELGQPLPGAERFAGWQKFLDSPVDPVDPIPFLRSGLEKAFDYPVYHDETVRTEDVDDLVTRLNEVEQAERFFGYKEQIRAAVRYLAVSIPANPELTGLKRALENCRERLVNLPAWLGSEARLMSEFLAPMSEAIASYQVRYLQALDTVAAHVEQVRQDLAAMERRPDFHALSSLAAVRSLGADPCPVLREAIRQALTSPELFPASLTRAAVERDLPYWPQPAGCPLTLENGADWMARADGVRHGVVEQVRDALLAKARLLYSPALKERLAQGKHEPLLASLLAADNAEQLAQKLVEISANPAQCAELVELLNRYLKKIILRKVRLSDFEPGKQTIEQQDVYVVVEEFQRFLLAQFGEKGEDELIVVEIE
jgi:hypothetical protein